MFGPYPTMWARKATAQGSSGIDPYLYRYLRSEYRMAAEPEAAQLLADGKPRPRRREVPTEAREAPRVGLVRFVATAMLDFLKSGQRATRPRRGAIEVPSERR